MYTKLYDSTQEIHQHLRSSRDPPTWIGQPPPRNLTFLAKILSLHTRKSPYTEPYTKQSKAKMCNGRRHVPLCPASANEK